MNISIVIPAYNERENIEIIIQELFSSLKKIPGINETEIIVVDDHSGDKTFEAVKVLGDSRVRCVRLSMRCGSHTAVRAGLKLAKGDAVLCISADGQDDPVCLASMLEKYHTGADIVWAIRKNRDNESWYISNTARLFYKILNWFNHDGVYKIDLNRADFYLLDRKVVNAVNSCVESNTTIFGLIAWAGFNQDFVEYERRRRKFGKTKWSFSSRFRLALDWIIAFSGLPLKFMSIIGMAVACFGFALAVSIAVNTINGRPPQGWSSIMVAILILGGLQMIMLGIIGEYLWRNIEESRRRPLYFIEKDTSG